MIHKLARRARVPLLLLSVAAPAPAAAQESVSIRSLRGTAFVSEDRMREQARNPVMPAYPEAALRDGVQGLAVALVRFDKEGVVIEAKILKAPDESIAASVRETLKQWAFRPWPEGPTMGTLRFDFSIEDGQGRVKYGSLDGVCYQQPGRHMPGGMLRQRLEDIDTHCVR
jgi:TonB family protein